ncbi:MAG TPA: ABC transporter ATP-binding protein, partial [Dehalococcoidia bacterium]|nr:ABC transporter ATP-binding protein [Dehalococcoidia bacterium]
EEADLAADRVVIIARGSKVADGTAAQIKASMGERRVQFTLDGDEGEPFTGWAAVRRSERFGRHVTLYSADADATVRALVRSGLAWRDLSIEAPDLEAAFLSLTGEAR